MYLINILINLLQYNKTVINKFFLVNLMYLLTLNVNFLKK